MALWMRARVLDEFMQQGTVLAHRGRGLVDKLQSFVYQDFAGAFAQAGSRDIGVAFEAIEIFLGQDVTKSIVRETEQQIMFAAHLAL
jgi:hypothetical protein